jgi:hypothetical protein
VIRSIAALGWVLTLYGLTAATAGLNVGPAAPPQATAAQLSESAVWFEANHVVLHAACFAVLMGIIAFGNRTILASRKLPIVASLVALAVLVGMGQEALQGAIRARLVLDNSLFDLVCDLAGALLTLGILGRKRLLIKTDVNRPAL